MSDVLLWVIIGAFLIYAVIYLVKEYGDQNTEERKSALQVVGVLLVFAAVVFPLTLTAKQILPPYGFFFGTDEDGEPFDRRELIATAIAFPVTYFLVLGINAHRANRRK